MAVVGVLVSCANILGLPPARPVSITDFKSAAGVWEGGWDDAADRDSDSLRLTISEDGRFEAESVRILAAFKASGQLTLAGGKLTFQGERGGIATATLFQNGSQRWLQIEVITKKGVRTTARLGPR